ncbi:MAG: putative DNA-binding domain-containing protein [Myxococcales bacterium]|nr:putative DNA-binding domain-containing protein [Myxococcales bacterium]
MVTTDCDVFFAAVTGGKIGQSDLERFVSRGALTPREGLENYRRMFLARQLEALAELYPTTEVHLGPQAFRALGTAYLRGHVSRHPALEQVGAAFPRFLAEAGDEPASRIAALEWAVLWVFLAEDERPSDGRLAPPPDRIAEATLDVSRALAIAPLDLETRSAWLRAGGAPIRGAEDETVTHVLVVRRRFEARLRAIGPDEVDALERARRGEPFASVCEAFLAAADPVAKAFTCVRGWLETGVARGFREST